MHFEKQKINIRSVYTIHKFNLVKVIEKKIEKGSVGARRQIHFKKKTNILKKSCIINTHRRLRSVKIIAIN